MTRQLAVLLVVGGILSGLDAWRQRLPVWLLVLLTPLALWASRDPRPWRGLTSAVVTGALLSFAGVAWGDRIAGALLAAPLGLLGAIVLAAGTLVIELGLMSALYPTRLFAGPLGAAVPYIAALAMILSALGL